MKFFNFFLYSTLVVVLSGTGIAADKGGLRHEKTDRELAACEQVCIDFSEANGDAINHGDYVKDEWLEDYGMTVEASTKVGGYTPDGKARIYDTSLQGADPDLGSPNKECGGHGVGAGGEPDGLGPNCDPGGEGNVLIIQESDKEEPDDNAQGGMMKFSFDCPVYKLRWMGLMDVDAGEQAFFEIFKDDKKAPTIQKITGKGSNSLQEERFDGHSVKNVTAVNLVASNSFAVRFICFCPGDCGSDTGVDRVEPPLPPPPSPTFPKTIEEANEGLLGRRVRLVQSWVRRYESEGFIPWKDDAKVSLRMIGAGLYVFAHPSHFSENDMLKLSGLGTGVSFDLHKTSFQNKVRDYLATAAIGSRGPGTAPGGDRDEGSYDFVLKEILPILYLYHDRPDILDKESVWYLLKQGTSETAHVPFSAESGSLPYLQIRVAAGRYKSPETENHVMMTYSWIYLINNYVKWMAGLPSDHERYDERVSAIYRSEPSRYDNDSGILTDFVLQILGRVVHSDLFETNAKPYESFTTSAIMNFYSFADKLFPDNANCIRVKIAALNALDYLAARFAFQSLESKRIAPMRRQWEYRGRVGYGENDYIPYMFGALSGAYRFNDAVTSTPDQAEGFALWAALLDYRLPDVVHDFMINKHTGYWARMQSRYGLGNYGYNLGGVFTKASNRKAQYFNSDGSVYISGDFSPVVQFYFVTPDYINVAGGYRRQYSTRIGGPIGTAVEAILGKEQFLKYNVQSRPNTIITKGSNNMTAFEKEMITMRGEKDFWDSKNLATYKSCTFGYFKDGNKERHLAWPQNSNSGNHNDNRMSLDDLLPPSWTPFARADFPIDRAAFRIYDFTADGVQHPLSGYYVLVGRMSKKTNRGQYREYSRGLFEVVPGHKYKSVNDLKNYVVGNNEDSLVDKETGSWIYQLASTGETVEVYDKFGSSAHGACNTFMKMRDTNGSEMNVKQYHVDHCSPESMRNDAGLIDVWEVDRDYKFTGRKFATGAGDGRIIITNPYLSGGSQTLVIDSRDYKNPSNTGATRSSADKVMIWQDRTYNRGALDIGCGGVGGESVYIIGPEDFSVYGSFIYKLEGESWAKIFGQGTRIVVDSSGQPWHINREGDIWQSIDGVWHDRGKKVATDIAIGGSSSSADTACIVGKDGLVYCSRGSSPWAATGRRLEEVRRVGVDKRGYPWVVAGEPAVVYRQIKIWRWRFWRRVHGHPEPVNDLSISPEEKVMITAGTRTDDGGYEIFEYVSGTTWKAVNGQRANEISVCGEGVWIARSNKSVAVGALP